MERLSAVGGNLLPNFRRLFLELPSDEDKVSVADFIIDSYNQQNISQYKVCLPLKRGLPPKIPRT